MENQTYVVLQTPLARMGAEALRRLLAKQAETNRLLAPREPAFS